MRFKWLSIGYLYFIKVRNITNRTFFRLFWYFL